MKSSWSQTEAQRYARTRAIAPNRFIGQCLYMSHLAGAEPDLAMHGGGNTSVKFQAPDPVGFPLETIAVKASGVSLDTVTHEDFVLLDLSYLKRLAESGDHDDAILGEVLRTKQVRLNPRQASVETLMHAFIDDPFVVHTHPSAILALTNRVDWSAQLTSAFGDSIGVVAYKRVGFSLAHAVRTVYEKSRQTGGIVIEKHGLVTWGATAKEAYDRTIALVTTAQRVLRAAKKKSFQSVRIGDVRKARIRYRELAPLLRGALSSPTGEQEAPYRRVVLNPYADRDTLGMLAAKNARGLLVSSPVTPDYLIRTRAWPMWIDLSSCDTTETCRKLLADSVDRYRASYRNYVGDRIDSSGTAIPLFPKVVLIPGVGAVCVGDTAEAAGVNADITSQMFRVKKAVYETGGRYAGIDKEHLLDMEFRALQRAKLSAGAQDRIGGAIALVTGAAGAIGAGICEYLLERGCHVAVSDLAGENLQSTVAGFTDRYGPRVLGVPMDVTDEGSVQEGFDFVAETWGGLDLLVVNAGVAHVSSLSKMQLGDFRRLERVNVEGTLLCLRQAARVMEAQGIGGDIVVVSTKNVFAPGAQFGAYSATKAASHQLARIGVVELAPLGIRVNMVSPDAVFSHGARRSGLWATVGPDRMKARGLDEQGLEEYYRSRNLLKAKVTAEHVAKAVWFFASRQTPTTGATLPVDGGLPDATPR